MVIIAVRVVIALFIGADWFGLCFDEQIEKRAEQRQTHADVVQDRIFRQLRLHAEPAESRVRY